MPQHVGEFLVARVLLDLLEEIDGRSGDLVVVGEQVLERVVVPLGDGRAVETEPTEDRAYEFGVVDRHHVQRVARFVFETGIGERELVVPDLLGRVLPGQQHVRRQHRRIGILAGPLRLRPGGCRRCRGGGSAVAHDALDGRDERQRLRDPRRGELLELDVAVHPRHDALRTELLEPHVDELARLAEPVVTGVAESEHREVHAVETRGALGRQCLPEQFGVVGHLALAVGGRDDQDLGQTGEPVEVHVVESAHDGREALGAGRDRGVLGDGFGIAGLRAVEHVQSGCRAGGPGIVGGTTGEQAGLHPGDEAGEPRPLIGGERGVEGNERAGGGHAETPIVKVRTFGTALRANSSS